MSLELQAEETMEGHDVSHQEIHPASEDNSVGTTTVKEIREKQYH